MQEGYNGGKAKIRPLDDDRLRASLFCLTSEFLTRINQNDGSGVFTFLTNELMNHLISTYGEGFNTKREHMEDVDMMGKIRRHGNYKFITESSVRTSMRRFMDHGYFKCLIVDSMDAKKPQGRYRERWK